MTVSYIGLNELITLASAKLLEHCKIDLSNHTKVRGRWGFYWNQVLFIVDVI